MIRPFSMSRDFNSKDVTSLGWVSFIELVMRIACIKFGTNELAVLAGKQTTRPSPACYR